MFDWIFRRDWGHTEIKESSRPRTREDLVPMWTRQDEINLARRVRRAQEKSRDVV